MKKYTSKQIEKTVDRYTFEVEASNELLEEQKAKVFPELAKDIKVPGFRPGKAPKHVIEEKLSTKLFTESVNRMLPSIAYEIIIENNLNPITNLEYSLKDIDDKKGVVFTFSFANYPEIKLADFSKISVKKKDIEIKNDEIDNVIQSIIKSSVPKEKWEKNIVKKAEKSSQKSEKKQDYDHEGHEHSHDHKHDDEVITVTDELVEALGYETEKTVEDLKKSVKEKLTEMKGSQNQQDYIDEVMKKAVEISKFELPKIFIDREVEIMENNFTSRLKDIKLDVDTYLKTQNTSLEEYRKDWEKQADERVRADLILLTLATDNKIIPLDKEVEEELESIKDPTLKAQYDNANGRDYIKTVMTKQSGLKKLLEIVEASEKPSKSTKKK